MVLRISATDLSFPTLYKLSFCPQNYRFLDLLQVLCVCDGVAIPNNQSYIVEQWLRESRVRNRPRPHKTRQTLTPYTATIRTETCINHCFHLTCLLNKGYISWCWCSFHALWLFPGQRVSDRARTEHKQTPQHRVCVHGPGNHLGATALVCRRECSLATL